MLPILLIHGYSSEGKDNSVKKIYGQLHSLLKKEFGAKIIKEIDLSRWISLNDGVSLDDVSFAMDRALKRQFPHLLKTGFHVLIHSTGALVVRNWIKQHSPKPSPIGNIVHLAGANFGSGLAHIGKGQLARWGRFIFLGTPSGTRILKELEFGNWKTLDMHKHFLTDGCDMYHDYQVQEFCLNGSQVFSGLLRDVINIIPIRYVKEDSSDNTVRTASGNLNFNYIPVTPTKKSKLLSARSLKNLVKRRERNSEIRNDYYEHSLEYLGEKRPTVPFGLLYETAHFGEDIGIVDGKKNRREVMPHIKTALSTPYDAKAYTKVADRFNTLTERTLKRAEKLNSRGLFTWNRISQYEAHSQLIFRLRDQFGNDIIEYDITFVSTPFLAQQIKLDRMLEDRHKNQNHPGTSTYYLRTMEYRNGRWLNRLDNIAPVTIEITAYEPDSSEMIAYVPLSITLDGDQIRQGIQPYCTTLLDITMMRLPREEVFHIERSARGT